MPTEHKKCMLYNMLKGWCILSFINTVSLSQEIIILVLMITYTVEVEKEMGSEESYQVAGETGNL